MDAQEWRLEVERVLPALKIHVRQDNRVRHTTYYVRDFYKFNGCVCLICVEGKVPVVVSAAVPNTNIAG